MNDKWKETLKSLVAMAFLSLVLFFFLKKELFAWIAFVVLAIGLFENSFAATLGCGWLAFSKALGKVSSFVTLSVVFYLVLVPLALLRRIFNRDVVSHFFDNSRHSLFEKIDRPIDRDYFEKIW